MEEEIEALFVRAVDIAGSETKLAAAAGVSQNAVWSARRNKRVSPVLAVQLEKATAGKVGRWEFRPDLWEAPARPDASVSA